MEKHPKYEELESRIKELEKEIGSRTETEKALRKERAFSEGIINTAQVIILVLDQCAGIVSFNRYMESTSGYRLSEVKGKDWFETFLPESDRERIRDVFSKAINGIKTQGQINPIISKDGTEIEIEWHDTTLKDEQGNTIGLLCIGQDVTERILEFPEFCFTHTLPRS